MTEHEHNFGTPRPGACQMCSVPECFEWGIWTGTEWREPTAEERVQITLIMMEDVIVHDAMVLIHGKERGPRDARYKLGYDR